MGNACVQKIESEEEAIGRIIQCLHLSTLDTLVVYDDFLKCLTSNNLDSQKFDIFLQNIIGKNNFSDLQKDYFKILAIIKTSKNIQMIGTMIILLSKGSDGVKVNLLTKHFIKYFLGERAIIEECFIGSKLLHSNLGKLVTYIIDCNTDQCLLAFRQYIGSEVTRNVSAIWKTKRKKKLLYSILNHLDDIKKKFKRDLTVKEKYGEDEFLNLSDILDHFSYKKDYDEEEEENAVEDEVFETPTPGGKFHSFNESIYEKGIVKEFLELAYPQLNGEYIRNYLYDEYMKERGEKICY